MLTNFIRNPNGMDSAEVNQISYNSYCTCFSRLNYQKATGKHRTFFTVKNWVHHILVHSPFYLVILPGIENKLIAKTKSKCLEKQEHLFDEDSWSIVVQEFFPDFDDEQHKLISEGHTVPCFYSDVFWKPSLGDSYTIVWSVGEGVGFSCLHFLGPISKRSNCY